MTDRQTDPQDIHKAARPFLFLDRPIVRDAISLGVVLIAMLLLGVDFFLSRHGETAIAGRPGFYAVFGFIAFGLIVLAGFPLRRLLLRAPDYYGEPEDRDA